MIASRTGSPRNSSAMLLRYCKTIAETSGGLNCLSFTEIRTSPLAEAASV